MVEKWDNLTVALGIIGSLLALSALILAMTEESPHITSILMCGSFLMFLLMWRCCCCCHPKGRSPTGSATVDGPQASLGPRLVLIMQEYSVNAAVINPGCPIGPVVRPVLAASYPTPGLGTFGAPPCIAGAHPPPAYRPANMPPHILQQLAVLQPDGGGDESTASQTDVPPSYSDAIGMPLTREQ